MWVACKDVWEDVKTLAAQPHGIGKSWGRSGDFWQWSSILSTAPSKLSVFLIWSISSTLKTAMSLRKGLRILNWSFKALWDGTFPEYNWDGSKLDDPRALRQENIVVYLYRSCSP